MGEGDEGEAEETRRPEHIRVDVYHHFPEGIPLSIDLSSLGVDVTGAVSVTIEQPAPPPAPQTVKATIRIKGASPMGLTVDTTTGNAVLSFEDDKGDATGPPPGDGSGLVVTFSSDNAAVCAVGDAAASADGLTYSAPLTPASEGSFNLGAVVANSSGADLTDADGTTAFEQPGSISVPVDAGQAARGSLAVTE